ncbi:MAG: serine/threonine protein kinase [bacterium]|nr:serine/threonine protein kinase [bacterium]
MDSSGWKKMRTVFEEARALCGAEREAFLTHACGADAVMREQVLGMLAVDEEAPEFLERPTQMPGVDAEPGARSGRIGAYEIVRLIAAGGMGVVYEAEQENPRRRVALKVLGAGSLAPSIARRFQYEAEILARLRHPHIAAIFEAGVHTDENGLDTPYFAMEFVRGARDIVSYVRSARCDLRTRLEIFMEVCDAVHYGHQQGVIHRDLKPGNILVDDDGRAKVIDFGVARATAADIAARTMATRTGELIGTLSYMSPEQLSGDPGAIDTRSDVYALGVVLYELLCGASPYALDGRPVTEIARIIRDVPPTDPHRAAPDLAEDLRWIALRALEKERDHRYASASELAADIRRFLEHEPVLAGPPSTYYRARKFVRRNRLAVAAATVVLAALGVGTVLATVGLFRASNEAERATDEADKFRSINEVLTDVFVAVQTDRDGHDVRAVELLDRAAEELGASLSGRPEVEAALHLVLAQSYESLGLSPRAETSAARARELWSQARLGLDPDQLAAGRIQASAIADEGRLDEARDIVDALRPAAGALIAANPIAFELAALDCDLRRRRGEAEAEQRLAELHATALAELGADDEHTLDILAGLIQAKADTRVDDEVVGLQRELLAAHERIGGADSYVALRSKLQLAATLAKRAKLEEAEQLYADALGPMMQIVGEEHPTVLVALNGLGVLHYKKKELAKSVTILEELVAIRERISGPEHHQTLTAKMNLAASLGATGDRRSLEWAREIFDVRRRLWGPDYPATLEAMANLGIALVGKREVAEAETVLLECLERRRRVSGDDHLKTIGAVHAVAYLYYTQLEFAKAEPYFREAWVGFRRELGIENDETLRAGANYSVILGRLGKFADAIPVATALLAVERERMAADDPNLIVVISNLAECHRRSGQLLQAEEIFRQALDQAREHLPEDHPHQTLVRRNLANCLHERGRHADAVVLFAEAVHLAEFNTAVRRSDYARVREGRGACLLALERPEEAGRELAIAFEVLEPLRGSETARKRIAEVLAKIHDGAGRTQEAAAWRAKIPADAGDQ